MMRELTENEWRAVEILRILKFKGGHGILHVEVAGGEEKLFTRETKELPPEKTRC